MVSIRERENRPGRPWEVTWREPETKRLFRKSFTTKRDAEAFRGILKTEIRNGTYIERRPVPFSVSATDWLVRMASAVSPTTHALHEWAVNGYPIPASNLTPVKGLKSDRIDQWHADHLRQGKPGPRSVKIILTVLNTILEDTRAKGYLFVNPHGAGPALRRPGPRSALPRVTGGESAL